jgi:hypothetical protein
MRATTLDGMRCKARIGLLVQIEDEIGLSIVEDLLAMEKRDREAC